MPQTFQPPINPSQRHGAVFVSWACLAAAFALIDSGPPKLLPFDIAQLFLISRYKRRGYTYSSLMQTRLTPRRGCDCIIRAGCTHVVPAHATTTMSESSLFHYHPRRCTMLSRAVRRVRTNCELFFVGSSFFLSVSYHWKQESRPRRAYFCRL